MDYGKSGNPKMSKDLSRQQDPRLKSGAEARPKGSTKQKVRPPATKEELLARLAAAKATKGNDNGCA